VDTRFVHRCKDGKTVVALAFLDDKNDASYSFYKNYPEKRLDIAFPQINKGDIILCGSFYSIAAEIREKFKNFIMGAKEKNAFVIYDPNFRKSHLNELEKLKSLIIENIQMATLLRGSDEDFKNIFGTANPDEAWDAVKKHSKCLVYTANVEGVYVRTTSFSGKFPVKKIKPVSTIGAGDNFNAGMITAFYQNNIYPDQLETLTIKDWERVISTAVKFATHVCRSYENYISFEFANKYFSASKLQM
jgi:fructokinase